MAHAREHFDDIGEVVLALGVVGAEASQRRAEQIATERTHAGPHLADGQHLGRGIALFDDLQHSAVAMLRGCTQHPPIAPWVVEHRRDRGGCIAAADVGGDELVQGLGAQQWRVAPQHDAPEPGLQAQPDRLIDLTAGLENRRGSARLWGG